MSDPIRTVTVMPDDAWSAVAELAASQHGAFTRRQAAHLRIDRRQVARAIATGWLYEPMPGILTIAGHAATWHRSVRIATLVGGGHGVASHRTAARLHRLDGFATAAVIDVSVENHHRLRLPPELGGIAHHVQTLPACDLVEIDGIPATGLARTLADLGAVVDDPLQVRRALSDARRRGTSSTWIRTTAERLHRPGPTGAHTLLGLLDAIPAEGRVPDSWFEELLALCLADPTLPPIVPQFRICDASGRCVARTDIGIPGVRLGLEGHTRRFHFGPDAEPLDEQRDVRAAACGWELLYLAWYATKRPAEVLAVVKEVVARRRRDLSPL